MTADAYRFGPTERPALPGAPFVPSHSPVRRLAYGAVVGWLTAIYLAMHATANLTLVKARIQFDISKIIRALLIAYVAVALLQLLRQPPASGS